MEDPSTLTLGSISDKVKVVGKWHSHKLIVSEADSRTLLLNVQKITYNHENLYTQSMPALLSSSVNDLMFVAGA